MKFEGTMNEINDKCQESNSASRLSSSSSIDLSEFEDPAEEDMIQNTIKSF